MSPYLVQKIQPGDLVRLGEIEGVFTLPDPLPAKMLFISAGSGITPIISMLRSLDRRDELGDVVVIHSARTREQVMFLSALEELASRHEGMRLDLRLTSDRGRLTPADLDDVCPDWREREAFCSGPGEMLDALIEHWEAQRRSRPPALRAVPAQDRRRRRRRGGRHRLLPRQRQERRM